MSMNGSVSKNDLIITVVRHAVNVGRKDLSDEVVEITKKHILDQIAVIIGGSNQPGCVEIVGQINRWGGKKEATIFSYGNKVPVHHAAQANATMGHALDYDDCDDRSSMHAGAAVIATAFTAAELKRKVKGIDFITAIATGLDIGYRLALCFPIHITENGFIFSWFHTQLFSYISAPITAGKILGLNEEQFINAIGIAFQEAAGAGQFMIDGGLNKRLAPGYAARAGIFACLLAQNNVTSIRNILEGQSALFNLYLGGKIAIEPLTTSLGKKYVGTEISLKPYPCCRWNHPFIDAALALKKEHNLKPEDIDSITVHAGKKALNNCEPSEIKFHPKTIFDTQFSIPWTVAVALTYGKVLIKDFGLDAIKDTSVLSLIEKISIELDNGLTTSAIIEPAVIDIRTVDGRFLSKRIDHPYGSPLNPMSWDDISAKLEDCNRYAVKPIAGNKLNMIIDLCKKLEHVEDIKSIINLVK